MEKHLLKFAGICVLGSKYVAANSEAGSIGSQSCSSIPRGGPQANTTAPLSHQRNLASHDAILERTGRIGVFELEIEFRNTQLSGKVPTSYQRGVPLSQRTQHCGVLQREQ
jgi:hypothetical protein